MKEMRVFAIALAVFIVEKSKGNIVVLFSRPLDLQSITGYYNATFALFAHPGLFDPLFQMSPVPRPLNLCPFFSPFSNAPGLLECMPPLLPLASETRPETSAIPFCQAQPVATSQKKPHLAEPRRILWFAAGAVQGCASDVLHQNVVKGDTSVHAAIQGPGQRNLGADHQEAKQPIVAAIDGRLVLSLALFGSLSPISLYPPSAPSLIELRVDEASWLLQCYPSNAMLPESGTGWVYCEKGDRKREEEGSQL